MCAIVAELVDLDNDEPSEECIDTKVVEDEVCSCAISFLVERMGRLQNEDALCEEQNSGRVEQWMCGEEHEVREENAGPDGGSKEDYASLGNDCRA